MKLFLLFMFLIFFGVVRGEEHCSSFCDSRNGVCIYTDDIASTYRTRSLPDHIYTKDYFKNGICYCREGFMGWNCSELNKFSTKTERFRNLGCRKPNKHNGNKCPCNIGYGSPEDDECTLAADDVCTLRGLGDPFFYTIKIPSVYPQYGWQCIVGNSEDILKPYRTMDYILLGIRGGVVLILVFSVFYLFTSNMVSSVFQQRKNYSMRFMVCSNCCLLLSSIFLVMFSIVNVLMFILEEKMNYVAHGWSFYPLYLVEEGTRLFSVFMLMVFVWVAMALPYRLCKTYFIDAPIMIICACPCCCYVLFFIICATISIHVHIIMLGNIIKLVTVGLECLFAISTLGLFTFGLLFWTCCIFVTRDAKPIWAFFFSSYTIKGVGLLIIYIICLIIEIVFLFYIVFSEFWRPLHEVYYTNRYIYIDLFFDPLIKIVHVVCVYLLFSSMYYLSSNKRALCVHLDEIYKKVNEEKKKKKEEEERKRIAEDPLSDPNISPDQPNAANETTSLLSSSENNDFAAEDTREETEEPIDDEFDKIIATVQKKEEKNNEDIVIEEIVVTDDDKQKEEVIDTSLLNSEYLGQINNDDNEEEEEKQFYSNTSNSFGTSMTSEERLDNMINIMGLSDDDDDDDEGKKEKGEEKGSSSRIQDHIDDEDLIGLVGGTSPQQQLEDDDEAVEYSSIENNDVDDIEKVEEKVKVEDDDVNDI